MKIRLSLLVFLVTILVTVLCARFCSVFAAENSGLDVVTASIPADRVFPRESLKEGVVPPINDLNQTYPSATLNGQKFADDKAGGY